MARYGYPSMFGLTPTQVASIDKHSISSLRTANSLRKKGLISNVRKIPGGMVHKHEYAFGLTRRGVTVRAKIRNRLRSGRDFH